MTQEEKEAFYEKQVERYRLVKEMITDPLRNDWYHMREVQLGQDTIFLKSILSLSAGVFGVSFAFINAIIPNYKDVQNKHILVISWVIFAITIILTLLCHLISSFVHSKLCEDIKNNIELTYEDKPMIEYRRWYYEWVTTLLELLAFAGFLCGLALFVGFIWVNI